MKGASGHVLAGDPTPLRFVEDVSIVSAGDAHNQEIQAQPTRTKREAVCDPEILISPFVQFTVQEQCEGKHCERAEHK
jgi:hypothetical protein